MPYHQRLDDGVVKFVNNDHCLLSARATLRLSELMPGGGYERLPMMQTIWYLPTGLDPWNQLLGKAPGHYTRMYKLDVSATPPPPQVHWQDQQPLESEGTLDERLNYWLSLVQRGEVLPAYRVFLGLLGERADRRKVLAQLVFAGLIDVQDRMLFNRSYTTGHKAYRARATVELANAIGWSKAHAVVYAGVPDMAVGPHWHSTWEMAANVCDALLGGRDHDLRQNQGELTPAEQRALEEIVLHGYQPDWQYHLTDLLKAGKGPRQIIDVLQVAAAELMLQCGAPENYSMPQHTAEYCNTLRWYFDAFDHPHQVKLVYVAAAMVNYRRPQPGGGPEERSAHRAHGAQRRSVGSAAAARSAGPSVAGARHRRESGAGPRVRARLVCASGAGPAAGPGVGQVWQRSAQPGDLPVLAGGLRPKYGRSIGNACCSAASRT